MEINRIIVSRTDKIGACEDTRRELLSGLEYHIGNLVTEELARGGTAHPDGPFPPRGTQGLRARGCRRAANLTHKQRLR